MKWSKWNCEQLKQELHVNMVRERPSIPGKDRPTNTSVAQLLMCWFWDTEHWQDVFVKVIIFLWFWTQCKKKTGKSGIMLNSTPLTQIDRFSHTHLSCRKPQIHPISANEWHTNITMRSFAHHSYPSGPWCSTQETLAALAWNAN